MEQAKGFTLIEVVVMMAILGIVSAIVVGSFVIMQKSADVGGAAQEFMGVLQLAQNRTLASEGNQQYGVYIDVSTTPDSYVLFRGATYASSNPSYAQRYWLPGSLEFNAISLNSGNEVVFERLTGIAAPSGSVTIRSAADTSQSKTVHVAGSGAVGLAAFPVPSDDNRTKDSRHVHFDYTRTIATATENLALTFNGNVVQNIPISTNMSAGQIYWKGTVAAGGTNQTVTVQTHRLNDAALGTQFSIHRSRDINDKSFTLQLSGDSTGTLVGYSADGATVTSTSSYASSHAWQ